MIEKYKPKNRIEFLEMIDKVYERKYENLNINLKIDSIEVEYDLSDSYLNREHRACFIPYPDFLLSRCEFDPVGSQVPR